MPRRNPVLAAFRNGHDQYIEVGDDRAALPVYAVKAVGGKITERTRMLFPACLRFFPYATDMRDRHRPTLS